MISRQLFLLNILNSYRQTFLYTTMFLKWYDIPWLKIFDIFITTREWWWSEWKYSSLNLWMLSGDNAEIVSKNRDFLARVLWRSMSNFIYLRQVHKAEVLVIDENNPSQEIWAYDAVVTNQSMFIPTILVADCVPIVVCDEELWVFWVIHSGWKGTFQNILKNTLEKMQSHFACDIKNISIIIWPCISSENYEVDDRVIENFDPQFYTENDTWWYQLDLRKCVTSQAIIAWCDQKNIYHIDHCTFENKKQFFSARRDGYKSGRFAMGIYKR